MPAIEPPKPQPLSTEQRATFLAEVTAGIGTREALRRAGVNGGSTALQVTHAYAKTLLTEDDELRRDYEIARGRDIDKVEGKAFAIATSDEHTKQWDAIKFLLERRHPEYAQHSSVDVNHTGEVNNPDVAAAVERFTALADAAIRAATREPAERPALEP